MVSEPVSQNPRLPHWLKPFNFPFGEVGLALLALGLGAAAGVAVVALPDPVYGFAALGGLLVGGLMLARPLFSLGIAITICCLLPFGVIPVKVGLTFTLLEATLLLLFVTWLLRLAVSYKSEQGLVSSPFAWAIFLLIGLSFFAYLLGWQTASSSDILHNYFKFLLAVLAFFPIINLVRTQVALDRLIKTLMLSGSLAGYIGLGLYFLNRPLQEQILVGLGRFGYPTEGRILRFDLDDPTKAQRATGTSIDPNSYGGMLTLIIALLLIQLVSPRPLFRRGLLVLMMVGPGVALWLTYGRGAQLGLLVVAFMVSFKYRRLWLYALPFIAVGLVVLPNTILGERFAAGFALEDPATKLRLSEYQNALDIIGRYPWFGIGFGSAPDPDLQAGVSSIYLAIGERMGLIGLAAFILVIILFFLYLSSNFGILRDEKQKANLLGLGGGVIGALAVGLLDHYYFNIEFSHMAALLWFCMGLAVAQVKIAESEKAKEINRDRQDIAGFTIPN